MLLKEIYCYIVKLRNVNLSWLLGKKKSPYKFFFVISFLIAGKEFCTQMGDYNINKDIIIYMYYSFNISWVCYVHSTINFLNLLVTWCTISWMFNNCTLCPHCIYVFCIYLRTNSNFCPIQHKLTGFYNRDGKSLLRGTNWVFK